MIAIKQPVAVASILAILALVGLGEESHAHVQRQETTPAYTDDVKMSQVELLCGQAGPARVLVDVSRAVDFTVVAAFRHVDHPGGVELPEFHIRLPNPDHSSCEDALPVHKDDKLNKARRNFKVQQEKEIHRKEQVETQITQAPSLLWLHDAPLYQHPEPHCHPREPIYASVSVIMHAAKDPFTIPEKILAEVMNPGGVFSPAFDALTKKLMSREAFEGLAGVGGMELQPGTNYVPLQANGEFSGYVQMEYNAMADLNVVAPGWKETSPEDRRRQEKWFDCSPDNGPPVIDEVEMCAAEYERRYPERPRPDRDDVDDDGEPEDITVVKCENPCQAFPGETVAGTGKDCPDTDDEQARMSCEQWRKMQRWIEQHPNQPLPSGWEDALPPKRDCPRSQTDESNQPDTEALKEIRTEMEQLDLKGESGVRLPEGGQQPTPLERTEKAADLQQLKHLQEQQQEEAPQQPSQSQQSQEERQKMR